MDWETRGHQSVKRVFERQLAGRAFSHAYLLIGPAGVGKSTLAMEFARAIVGAQGNQLHPDVLVLDNLVDGGADAVRAALGQVSGTPLIGSHRVVMIEHVDALNTQSANALLKTLEEPSQHTLFILTASSQNVLATIRSRCQAFACNPLSDAELIAYAQQYDIQASPEVITLANGSIGKLLLLVKSGDAFKILMQQLQSLNAAARGTNAEKMMAVQQFAELESEALEAVLVHWLSQLKRQLGTEPQLHKTITVTADALTKLRQSMNKKLIVQSLLLNA